MSKKITLSVILPTYNCVELIERHIASMQNWLDLADEIIVADSHSTDGTNEIIRQRLQHPNLKIIQCAPGIYESWNLAIAQTQGKWIYISTAGDIIGREHLKTLLNLGEVHQADVVISPQRFVDTQGQPFDDHTFVNAKIYQDLKGPKIAVLQPPATQFYAFECAKPNALLGSVASDLFKGDHLRARPFSTQYGTHGDTAWLLKYARETRLCLLHESGADFCLHLKHHVPSEPISETLLRMYQTELPLKDASEVRPYKFLLKKTSQLWFEKKTTKKHSLITKVSKTLAYLYFRSLLALEERKVRSQIRCQISFFES